MSAGTRAHSIGRTFACIDAVRMLWCMISVPCMRMCHTQVHLYCSTGGRSLQLRKCCADHMPRMQCLCCHSSALGYQPCNYSVEHSSTSTCHVRMRCLQVYLTLGEFIAWVTVSNLLLVGWQRALSAMRDNTVRPEECADGSAPHGQKSNAICMHRTVWSNAVRVFLRPQEYILANAAAVRGFAPYLAILCNKPSDFFLHSWNGYTIDGWGCGVTIIVTIILAWGIRESATVNTGM